MLHLAELNWGEVFIPDKPLEVILRGTLVYLAIFVLLRVVLKRQAGNVGLTDMLLIVLIADASQNAMANEYRSVPDGLLLVGTLIFWDYVLDWLGFRWRWLGQLLESPPLPLIRDGRILADNLRKEMITEDELRSQLRQKGYAGPTQVREGYIEGDGHFSFLPPPGLARAAFVAATRNGSTAENGTAHAPEPADPPLPTEEPAPGEEVALRQFLDAARHLQDAVAWHRDRIAEHQQAIAAITGALTRHGVRGRALHGEHHERPHDRRTTADDGTTA